MTYINFEECRCKIGWSFTHTTWGSNETFELCDGSIFSQDFVLGRGGSDSHDYPTFSYSFLEPKFLTFHFLINRILRLFHT